MTILFIMVFSLLGLAAIFLAGTHNRIAENQKASDQAFWLADGALERARVALPGKLYYPGQYINIAEDAGTYDLSSQKYRIIDDEGNVIYTYKYRWLINTQGTVRGKTRKIEAFGGIVGSFKKRKELEKAKIPVISAFTLDIDQNSLQNYLDENTLAGLFNPFRHTGNQAAEITADIFQGLNTIEKTVPRSAKQLAFINLKAARKLNRPISFNVLESVDIVIQ